MDVCLRPKAIQIQVIGQQSARLELARQLQEQARLFLPDIAQRCGFQAERSLRLTWTPWLPETLPDTED